MSSKTEEEVELSLCDLAKKVDELESHIKPLLQRSLPEVFSKLSAVEIAKLEISLAFALDSLMFSKISLQVYMKLQGMGMQDHAVVKELQRVKLWIKKVKQAENLDSASASTVNINVNAANRFIRNALWQNDKKSRK
jgi:exosome complex protein LRP1